MTKFMGFSQTLAYNSGASGTNFCVTSIDYSRDVNVSTVACAGGQDMAQVIGMRNTTATVNGTVDSQALDDVLGASGTFLNNGSQETDWVHNPEGSGTGNPTITSTSAYTGSVTWSVPSNDIVAFTATIHFDNLTVAALA